MFKVAKYNNTKPHPVPTRNPPQNSLTSGRYKITKVNTFNT